MSAGNVTPWGSSAAGEEVWVASGVEVEGAELPTFCCREGASGSDCRAVCFFGWREPGRAVVSDTTATQPAPSLSDATWNITVQWLAGDIACWTLVPETSGHVCRSFPACGHWVRPPGSCTPPVWTALSWKEAAWGSLGTQPPARLAPGE